MDDSDLALHPATNRISSDINDGRVDDAESQSFLAAERAVNDDDSVTSTIGNESASKNERPALQEATCYLHRSAHALYLFALYATLAVFTWVMLCILKFRPVTTKTYSYNVNLKRDYLFAADASALYTRNTQVFQAITIFQAIVAVLTIPITSAICTAAAVIFTQRNVHNTEITLRQTMVLADKGWTDAELLTQVILKGWKRYGTSFLAIAIVIHILGGLIAPLQQYFLSEITIRTPTQPQYIQRLCDIADHFRAGDDASLEPDDNAITVLARSLMASTSGTDLQTRLWQGAPPSCNNSISHYNMYGSTCDSGGASLAHLSPDTDPFVAQLSSEYNTGLVTQYLPRINSTGVVDAQPTDAVLPSGCSIDSGDFYVQYTNPSSPGLRTYNIMACMPYSQTQSPWRDTTKRQDFSETLYIKINTTDDSGDVSGIFYKVVMNTTAGYFELPNHEHSVAGPLLADGPPGEPGPGYEPQDTPYRMKRQTSTNLTTLLNVESVPNKGPLLTIALALFGQGSFIANRADNPTAYLASKLENKTANEYMSRINIPFPWHCGEAVPFARLLPDVAYGPSYEFLSPCARNNLPHIDDLVLQVQEYVDLFRPDLHKVEEAFNAAAFLANEAWLMNPPTGAVPPQYELSVCSRYVHYDPGAASQKPSISITGIAVISTLLGIYLLCLFAIAMYSYTSPRWTSQLDSFAMMRVGAAMADDIQLKASGKSAKLDVLDRTPGYIGDRVKADSSIREIGLGLPGRISLGKLYASCI